MTWFGYLWLVALAVSSGITLMEIGQPRKPQTVPGALVSIGTSGFIFWGAATVGVFR